MIIRNFYISTLSIVISVFGTLVILVSLVVATVIDNKPSGEFNLSAMDNVIMEPVAYLKHGLYLCRLTTTVTVTALGRRVQYFEVSYCKLNDDQINIVQKRIHGN